MLQPGESRGVWIPVVISSREATAGTVAITAAYEDRSGKVQTGHEVITVRPDNAERTKQYAQELAICDDFERCSRGIEYFRYVKHEPVADRLTDMLGRYPFFTAAAGAVFTQERRGNAPLLSAAADMPNADKTLLAELARRRKTGNYCREQNDQSPSHQSVKGESGS